MHEPKAAGRKMLVVDDDEVVRLVTRQLLEHLDFEVISVASGGEALDYVHAHPDTIEIALVDARMPGMTGHELIRRLHAVAPAIQVVLCTGASEDWRAPSVENLVGVLRKPFAMADLKAALAGIARPSLCA